MKAMICPLVLRLKLCMGPHLAPQAAAASLLLALRTQRWAKLRSIHSVYTFYILTAMLQNSSGLRCGVGSWFLH